MATDSRVSWFVALLVVLFGGGAWISISGIWVEVPILILQGIPEQYEINSYITIVIQMALVGPLIFLLFNRFAPKRCYRPEIPVIYVTTFVATFGTLLVACTWDKYTVWTVDGKLHSTAFLVLLFFISLVDVSSNVTFVGFMSIFKSNYLNWYWVGQGTSALWPTLVMVIQKGTNHNQCVENSTFINRTWVGNYSVVYNCTEWTRSRSQVEFGPTAFFYVLAAMMLICHLSFVGLNVLPCAKREYEIPEDGRRIHHDPCGGLFKSQGDDDKENALLLSESVEMPAAAAETEAETASHTEPDRVPLSTSQYIFLYVIIFMDFFVMYGIMSPIQSYSGSAYGQETYQCVVIFRNIAKVAGFLLFLVKPVHNFPVVIVTFLFGFVASIYGLTAAVMSPHPPLEGLFIGKILIVIAWIFEGTFFIYCQAATMWIVRKGNNTRHHLIWTGLTSQIAAVLGTVLMFPLVSVFHLFQANKAGHCDGTITCTEFHL
ncbi:solute carrier family 52, riboflavin transporter, member 3-B-like [Diadema antillarum]|uniref:solute carrier family 52, riboflavin transporter, member 3-B-like n=1 Tax=Diadema antillarum TaxID=105358 RepID=UPI003A8841D1